jgi:hypothetical protein
VFHLAESVGLNSIDVVNDPLGNSASPEMDAPTCGLLADKSAPNARKPNSGTVRFRLPMGRSFSAV